MSFDKATLGKGLRAVGTGIAAGMSPQVAQSQQALMRQNEQNEAQIEASLLENAIQTAQTLPDNDPRKVQILQNDVLPILERRAPTVAESFKRGLPSVQGINPVEQGNVPQPGMPQTGQVPQQDAQIPGPLSESRDAAKTRLELERIEKQRQAVKQRIPQLIEDPDQRDTFLTLADTTDDPMSLLDKARQVTKVDTSIQTVTGTDGMPRKVIINSRTGEPIADLGIAPPSRQEVGEPGQFTGTKTQVGEDIRELDFVDNFTTKLDEMIQRVEEDPTLVGAVGSVRRFGQTASGVAEDLGSVFGDTFVGGIMEGAADIAEGDDTELTEEQKQELFNNPDISRLKLFENSLGLALARLRHPDGRVPVDVIKRSISDMQLTGFTSSKDVINRLKEVRDEMEKRRKNLRKRTKQPSENDGNQTVIRFDSQGNIIE